jgi:hypothetical protein
MKASPAVRASVRHTRQELRPPRKVCPLCTPVFEADHIGGYFHIPHIVVEWCEPHHAALTALRLDADAEMEKQPTKVKTVAIGLRSIAVTLDAIREALGRCSDALRWLADQLLNKRGAK